MKKFAFIYPGQGSQSAGMGRDFYEQSSAAKEIFEEGSELLGIDLKKLCFEKNELLDRTDYTQIALLTTCTAMTRELESRGIQAAYTAGLSLGEYTAITTAGGMSFADALETVWLRGRLMQQAMQEGSGGMAAVLGLTGAQIDAVLAPMETVSVANYNCPGQIVITGEKKALAVAAEALKKAGAKRVLPLKVSGPFHSPFMLPASEKLGEKLQQISWKPLCIPYLANVNAEWITEVSRVPELLKRQVSASVLWEQSMKKLLEKEADAILEIGPGKTLAGFLTRIDKSVHVCSISSMEQIEREKQIC